MLRGLVNLLTSTLFRLFILIVLAIYIYNITYSSQEFEGLIQVLPSKTDNPIEDFTSIKGTVTIVSLNQDAILLGLMEPFRSLKICGSDEGTFIIFSGDGTNWTIESTFWYNGVGHKVVQNKGPKEKYSAGEHCFDVESREDISWKWTFDPDLEPVNYPNGSTKEDVGTVFKVSQYIKKGPVAPLAWFVLSLFYSGILLLALTGIYKFVQKGFKS